MWLICMVAGKDTSLNDKTLRGEHVAIFVLCMLAGIRVFIFAAAFPPFNNVDEEHHFDMVYKYSEGAIPKSAIEPFSPEALSIISQCQSPEYLLTKDILDAGGIHFSTWADPNIRQSEAFKRMVSVPEKTDNMETGTFPFYYIIAGLWCAVGRCIGMAGKNLVYWIRFLDVPLFISLVWLSYSIAKVIFPEKPSLRIALPLLIAFFPQDTFYSITNDSLSPVLFAVSFLMVLKILFENKSNYYAFLAGLFISAAFLTKISNFTVLLLLLAVLFAKSKCLLAERNFKGFIPLITLSLAAMTPIALWLLRNHIVFGDALATVAKENYFGWKIKPFDQLLNHPIFTLRGCLYFLAELTKTFWRGEIVWHFKPIASSFADGFYVFSTAVIVPVAAGAVIFKRQMNSRYKFAISMSFGLIAVSVLFLAALSVIYDFSGCWYPSRQSPYFASGRLISSALVPFLLIYLGGLEQLFRKAKTVLIIAMLIATLMVTSEIILSWEVFKSSYNWFH
jgi:hypothetical protein